MHMSTEQGVRLNMLKVHTLFIRRVLYLPISHSNEHGLHIVTPHMSVVFVFVQWLKLPDWKVGDCGFESHSGLQVLKKQNVASLLTRKHSILWGSSVT